jgi:hypothetical protein
MSDTAQTPLINHENLELVIESQCNLAVVEMVDFKVIIPDSVDTVFSWESGVDREPNKCRMRVYWITWDKAIVIATDLTNNPGRKIANVTKEIISFTSHIYDLVPSKIMLIEHYLISDSSDADTDLDTYLQVLLTNNGVVKYAISNSQVSELIGLPI